MPSSGLAFFSEKRVDSLVKRLGHIQVRDLVQQIDKTIRTRLLSRPGKDISLYSLASVQTELVIYPEAESHIQRTFTSYTSALLTAIGYFEVLHPIYPFLDRQAFNAKVSSPNLLQVLEDDYAFCALYYAVLALGCQYNGYSSFIPEDSHAWKLFQTALTRLDRILMTAESLANLQVSQPLQSGIPTNRDRHWPQWCVLPRRSVYKLICRPFLQPIHLAFSWTRL